MNENQYKNCRWCKWFDKSKGVCSNEEIFEELGEINNVLYPFWEEGTLSEAIKEGFVHQADIETRLSERWTELGVPRKLIITVELMFADARDAMILNWTERIDNSVSDALNNFEFVKAEGVKIKNPEEFCCNHFW